MSDTALLERDEELGEVEDLADAAAAGEGAVLLAEGPAGIGKSAMLRAARDAAAQRRFRVLTAAGSPLDRAFSFGVVHQLFDGEVADADEDRLARLFAGAARNALPVLEPGAAGGEPAPSHAILHGLYWLCANLAEERPLAIVVDDLHWADGPSLRMLEFLGRRLEGLPLLVAGAIRTGEPDVDEQVLALLAAGPVTRVMRPRPLSAAATGRLVGDALGHEPEQAFTEAVQASCGGNPLLLRELLRAASGHGLQGAAAEAATVPALGAEGVGTTVHRRLVPLGEDVQEVARACAVLGDRVRADDLVALTGLGETAVHRATERLVEAEILQRDTGAFVHPLVRQAVEDTIPGGRRAELHAAAARQLRERGARGEEIAAHLLAAPPGGEAWVVETLRRVAASAAAEGAPGAAAAHLRRALAEGPDPEVRPLVLLELGEAEAQAGEPTAVDRLDEALHAGLTGDIAARARAAQARMQLLSDQQRADASLALALEEAEDPALVVRLRDLRYVAAAYSATLEDRRQELMAEARAMEDPPATSLAHLAFDAAYGARPADEAIGYAERALREGRLLAEVGPDSGTYTLCVLALRVVEARDMLEAAVEAAAAERRRTGALLTGVYTNYIAALGGYSFGPLATAEAHAREGLQLAHEAGLPTAHVSLLVALGEVLLERDALDEARELLDGVRLTPELERQLPAANLLSARGKLRDLEGRRDEAVADLRHARELLLERGWVSPLKTQATLRLVDVLARAGERDEAAELAAGQEQLARRVSTPGVVGVALRAKAQAAGADVDLLRSAAEHLATSPLVVERGWALHDLGAALRRGGHRRDARGPLREALDVAAAAGASRLASAAREELLAAGGRPRREQLSGPASLTPSERRVAELAASGMSNREIAETLWVARKTVEVHLGRVYAKLDISSRSQLPDVLGGDGAPAEQPAA